MNKHERTAKYQRANIRRVNVKLNINTMLDVLEHLENQESMQGYIIELIRRDMAGKDYAAKWAALRQIVKDAADDQSGPFMVNAHDACNSFLKTMEQIENE